LMSIMLADHLATGELPVRHGSGVAMIVPYQAFEAADGYMMVAAGNDNLFRRLAGALGRSDLANDPRFKSNGERVVNRTALIAILADIFKTKKRAHWATLLDAQGIPNGPINSMDQVIADPQTHALGQIQRQGALSLIGLPLSFDGQRPQFSKRAPALGEDNATILR